MNGTSPKSTSATPSPAVPGSHAATSLEFVEDVEGGQFQIGGVANTLGVRLLSGDRDAEVDDTGGGQGIEHRARSPDSVAEPFTNRGARNHRSLATLPRLSPPPCLDAHVVGGGGR